MKASGGGCERLAACARTPNSHFRGEYLLDTQFITNTLVDTFGFPVEKVPEFLEVFLADLKAADLIEEKDGKQRVLDATHSGDTATDNSATLAKLAKGASVKEGDTCFVMMPRRTQTSSTSWGSRTRSRNRSFSCLGLNRTTPSICDTSA